MTQAVYERNAARFDAERPKRLHERPWLERFTAPLPSGAAILDLGCGAGDPICFYLQDQGFAVTGIDASAAMIALARRRRPDGDWRIADMRTVQLSERFDGLLCWNSFFHLTQAEQRALLPRLAALLNPRGRLMLTVGPKAGEEIGHVGGEPVHHSSLSPEEYAATLSAEGLDVVDFVAEDPECDFQTILLAERRPGATR